MPAVHELRIRSVNQAPVSRDGDYVLYWMIANRRTRWNFALDRAVEWCRTLDKPLLILEAITSTYEWASARVHTFVLQGMADNAARLEQRPAAYYPYVEPSARAGRGLVQALGKRASVVVTDEYPAFFLPEMVARTAGSLAVRLEAVDSNGMLPLRATEHTFPTAYAFRRFLQKELPRYWDALPRQDALRSLPKRTLRLPPRVLSRWPRATAAQLESAKLTKLPINHDVPAVSRTGGETMARRALQRFVREHLASYNDARNEPERQATSGLSPYLHFGHLSAHEVFQKIMQHEEWSPDDVAENAAGKRAGWWGVSAAAEAFLDQLVTWRELSFNTCHTLPSYDRFESLPEWAQATLQKHAADERQPVYTRDALEGAQTHDPLWNAAQTQLVREGTIHNYLRMLWGKNILAWSPSPWEALDVLIELNNKYALDGRDPNSYAGIFWCLGRYDRPWGPEREVFGTIRYMTSKNTARKYRIQSYVQRFSDAQLELER